MNILYNITRQLHDDLNINQEKLSHVRRKEFLYQSKNLNKIVDVELRLFLENKLNSNIVIKQISWGEVPNLDILAEFLSETIYTSIPHGSYEQDEVELKTIKQYQDLKLMKIKDVFYKFAYINLYINDFITFVRQNYDSNFFNKIKLYEHTDLNDLQISMYHVCTKLLRPGNYFYSKDLKTAKNVFEAISEEEINKEDLISFFIDSSEYSKTSVEQYKLILGDIDNFLELANTNKKNILELDVYINFANNLKLFIQKRIKDLSCSVLKK